MCQNQYLLAGTGSTSRLTLLCRKPGDDLVFLTDADVTLPSLCEKVELCISLLKDKYRQAIDSRQLVLPSNQTPLDIVIEADDFERNDCMYYIVDHTSRHLLWLHKHTVYNDILATEAQVGEPINEDSLWAMAWLIALQGHILKIEYYQHLFFYPHHQHMSDDFLTEMRGILVWGLTGELYM